MFETLRLGPIAVCTEKNPKELIQKFMWKDMPMYFPLVHISKKNLTPNTLLDASNLPPDATGVIITIYFTQIDYE